MSSQGKVKVGIIGSQFEADIHAASFQIMPEEAEVVAVASPTAGHAEELAQRYGIPRVFHDYREMLKEPDIEMITITAPNKLHASMTCDAAQAGKHVVCEKPLCMTLEEADEMIEVCRQQGVLLMYAEELYFTPKYVKAKEMADQGAFGKVYLVKQAKSTSARTPLVLGRRSQSGGGVFMDMGCHGIAFCYWFLGRPAIKSVLCQMGTYVHEDKTRGEDNSICILEFENRAVAWWRTVGPGAAAWRTDRSLWRRGVTYADLHMGNALPTYSEYGLRLRRGKSSLDQGLDLPGV